jgi:predicted nucleotidyltransferase
MSQTEEYPRVTEQLLDEVVRRVLGVGSPYKIVLFGSRARGDARPDSDLDLLILEDSELPRYERSPRYYHVLTGLFPAKDIVVYTPEEVKEWSDVPNAFVTAALREGKVLYGDTD